MEELTLKYVGVLATIAVWVVALAYLMVCERKPSFIVGTTLVFALFSTPITFVYIDAKWFPKKEQDECFYQSSREHELEIERIRASAKTCKCKDKECTR